MEGKGKIMEMVRCGMKNKEFNDDILIADGDIPITNETSLPEQMLFACTYYGWLVGKYGNKDWFENR